MILPKRMGIRALVRSSFDDRFPPQTQRGQAMNYRELYAQARALNLSYSEIYREDGTYIRNASQDREAQEKAARDGGFIATPYERLNALVKRVGVRIVYGIAGDDQNEPPNYNPMKDAIFMPAPESFTSPDAYANVLLHELSHWTRGSHDDRVGRVWHDVVDADKQLRRTLAIYNFMAGDLPPWTKAVEELVAEVSASILRESLNIPDTVNSPRYVRAWLTTFDEDVGDEDMSRFLDAAGKDGERAAAWLLERA